MLSYVAPFCNREENQQQDGAHVEGQAIPAESERNDGDEGFVEDYIDHDHHLEERRKLSHPDHLSTSSADEDDEVYPRFILHSICAAPCEWL